LPRLEIHTLNQVELELPELLLERARDTAAGLIPAEQAEKTPDHAGVFSFEAQYDQAALFSGNLPSALYSATGTELPYVHRELIEKEYWESTSSPLGSLATKAAVSTTTACWSILKARNDKGYVRLYNADKYDLDDQSDKRYGITAHKLALLLHRRESGESTELPLGAQIDHVCRNTACCNPNHLEVVTNSRNDELKRLAHPIEAALGSGQLMVGPTGLPWLDENIGRACNEDTNVIINTRFGPFRIMKIEDDPPMIYGVREACDLFDSLRPPTPRISARKSRARRVGMIAGQQIIEVED
jgi:hypothetical protein